MSNPVRAPAAVPDVVIGSGPSGLAAAIVLARAGHAVTVYEGAQTIGVGARSAELTLPGFVHDMCSAAHPVAVCSPCWPHPVAGPRMPPRRHPASAPAPWARLPNGKRTTGRPFVLLVQHTLFDAARARRQTYRLGLLPRAERVGGVHRMCGFHAASRFLKSGR